MITVKYSCNLCGIKNREVQIPAREHADVDVVKWMKEVVGKILSDDHALRSPNCHPTSLSDVMIPMPPEAEFIGQQIE